MQELIDKLRECLRRRQAWHRAEKSLTLQAKAYCRRLCSQDRSLSLPEVRAEADTLFKSVSILVDTMSTVDQQDPPSKAVSLIGKPKRSKKAIADSESPHFLDALLVLTPLLTARTTLEHQRAAVEKQMVAHAKKLPIAGWISATRGFGMLNLAILVGEAGDLSNYSTPAKLWKRMGLAPFNGRAPATWRVKGGASADDWTAMGYNPKRRSAMWNIGQCVIKAQSASDDRAAGEYRALYDQRKAYELERIESKAHANNRALRYVEKRILLNTWRAWRAASARAGATVEAIAA